jgi:hypothetical protein
MRKEGAVRRWLATRAGFRIELGLARPILKKTAEKKGIQLRRECEGEERDRLSDAPKIPLIGSKIRPSVVLETSPT